MAEPMSLYVAAALGNEDLVKIMISKNTDVNEMTIYMRTPLFAAVYHSHYNVVATLLKHPQIDVNRPDVYGRTPLHEIAKKGWSQESFRVANALMAHPMIDVNAKDLRGNTPLHLAIRHLGFAVMPVLLRSPKLDFTATDKNGLTAQKVAQILGHATLAESIRQAAQSQQARKNIGLFRCSVKLVVMSRRNKLTMYAPGGPGARAAIERLSRRYM
jgi:ankyrin repeat protein